MAYSFEIAPQDEALTFARAGERLLLVSSAGPEGVEAVNLGAFYRDPDGNPFHRIEDLYDTLGYDLLRGTPQADTQSYSWQQLQLPVAGIAPHIAAGTNFRTHAEEVGHDGDPFLFPKRTDATAWNADVAAATRLDYEVELCAVTLTPHRTDRPAELGFLLCNDFTDRWTLVREIDQSQPMGRTGFADAKGGATRLPVGALLVVPKQPLEYYKTLQLGLYVDGAQRQGDVAGLMIWPPDEILDQALAQCDNVYQALDGTVKLTPCDEIAAGTLVLTGTPEGVAFHLMTLWRPGAYLQAGQRVVTSGQGLGLLVNRVQ